MAQKRKSLTRRQKADLYELHKGICWRCKLPIDPIKHKDWHAGHCDQPHWLGGFKVAPEHKHCNMEDAKEQKTLSAKSDRIRATNMGIPKSKGRSFNRLPKPKPKRGQWQTFICEHTGITKARWLPPGDADDNGD